MPQAFETIAIPKTPAACGLCEEYAAREAKKPVVVMACEGACLRGELARLAANQLCDELAPQYTVRLCLGGAFTKNTGQRELARKAPRLIAIEGCSIDCASRMMQGVLPESRPTLFRVPDLTRFDSSLFSIREMPEAQRKACAFEVAVAVAKELGISEKG
jgi:DGC domain